LPGVTRQSIMRLDSFELDGCVAHAAHGVMDATLD
jgi:hypothetical protein